MSMKNLNVAFTAIIVIATIGFIVLVITRSANPTPNNVACTMDALICPDGTAVGRSGPDCAFAPCPQAPEDVPTRDDVQAHIDSKDNLIRVTSVERDDIVSSPLTITGEARGTWFFEASFPISVVDWDGLIIGEGIATAEGEWMTEEFVPFSATIEFTVADDTPYRRGAVIFKKDNPSGLPEHDDALEIPVQF